MKKVHKYSGLVSYLMFYTSICSDHYDEEAEVTHVVFRFSGKVIVSLEGGCIRFFIIIFLQMRVR